MNKFYEQFISKDYGTLPNAINIVSKAVLLIAIAIFAIMGIVGIFFTIPLFIIFILIEVYMANKFLEYEYEYYDKELTIAKIINKKRRKTICNIEIDKILNVLPLNNSYNDGKIVNCTIKHLNLKQVVIFINNKNNKKTGYLLGLDNNLLDILKKDSPMLFNHIQ